eukprot:Awhi_evm1s13886
MKFAALLSLLVVGTTAINYECSQKDRIEFQSTKNDMYSVSRFNYGKVHFKESDTTPKRDMCRELCMEVPTCNYIADFTTRDYCYFFSECRMKEDQSASGRKRLVVEKVEKTDGEMKPQLPEPEKPEPKTPEPKKPNPETPDKKNPGKKNPDKKDPDNKKSLDEKKKELKEAIESFMELKGGKMKGMKGNFPMDLFQKIKAVLRGKKMGDAKADRFALKIIRFLTSKKEELTLEKKLTMVKARNEKFLKDKDLLDLKTQMSYGQEMLDVGETVGDVVAAVLRWLDRNVL